MRAFPNGVRLDENENEYQAALQEYHDGLVVNGKADRLGRRTIHRGSCETLRYDLATKQQNARSAKFLFHGPEEVARNGAMHGIKIDELNQCSRCKPEM